MELRRYENRTGSNCKGTSNAGHSGACAINDCSAIIDCMASITIRKLEEATKRKLKVRAAMNGRSMEQEAREILNSAMQNAPSKSGANLAETIHRRFARSEEHT